MLEPAGYPPTSGAGAEIANGINVHEQNTSRDTRPFPSLVVSAASDEGVLVQGTKQLGEDKIARNRANFGAGIDAAVPMLRKPSWIRVRIPPGNAVAKLKAKLRANRLVTVCEEASCPNIHECFGKGTATFMILGEVCTRRCSFCDVAHGRRNRRMPKNRAIWPKPSTTWACATWSSPRSIATTCAMAVPSISPTASAKCVHASPGYQDRDPYAGFPRQGPHGARAGSVRHDSAGCVQPQPGNRARAVSERASGCGLRLVA